MCEGDKELHFNVREREREGEREREREDRACIYGVA